MTRDDVHSNYSPTRTNTTMVSHRLLFLTVICSLLASKVFAQDEDPEESEEGNEPTGPPPEYVTLTVAGKTVKGIKAKAKDNFRLDPAAFWKETKFAEGRMMISFAVSRLFEHPFDE